MTEDKPQFNTIFGDNNDDAAVCGPDGCNIAEHQKQTEDKKKTK